MPPSAGDEHAAADTGRPAAGRQAGERRENTLLRLSARLQDQVGPPRLSDLTVQ